MKIGNRELKKQNQSEDIEERRAARRAEAAQKKQETGSAGTRSAAERDAASGYTRSYSTVRRNPSGKRETTMRDRLYEISDILTAVGILVVAAGLIFWRMEVLMHYGA